MGTDGLWDNLYDADIEKYLTAFLSNDEQINKPEIIAKLIAQQAEKMSQKMEYESPFTREAKKHGLVYMGGKPDDITVVVAQIIENN